MSLEAHGLDWRAGGRLILDQVSLQVPPGELMGLLGPNGSGKSTLLRLFAGLARPARGEVLLDGAPLARRSRRDIARRIALVEQHATTDTDISVLESVRLGRTPHRSAISGWSANDQRAVDSALDQVGLADKCARRWHTLSGGERQRVQIARALAQQPSELLLDEPTNHLDIQHQLELLELVRRLPLTCVMAIHDLNLAAMFCDTLAVLDGGRLVAFGAPEEVLTPALIERVYGVRALVSRSTPHRRPHVQYLPLTPSSLDQEPPCEPST
ncbi:ABC transporter ATP-binding protein [Halotalea alkalilenta]|uniref:ABC transporter ATP-binding protein n=1 Tax=Halotalea alkalilenta TaxID=376489 RepID=UPI000694D4FA|nr:ABC transporter ATP-binding protein [Halotalea alkalilenta]